MKSCEYIKGRLGLSQYRDDDVFKGIKVIRLENRSYISDADEKEVYKNIMEIRIRVIKNCQPKELF